MSIAHDVADTAARSRVHRLTKVGFSAEQAFALEAGSWSQDSLEGTGLFTRVQVEVLLATPTEADLIRKEHFTGAQAKLVFGFYLD